MRFDPPLASAVLQRRYKRFLADVTKPDGTTITLHCPNTGAMHGCNEPDSPIWYSTSANPKRKYPHTLEAVITRRGIAGVNTGRANSLVAEALVQGQLVELDGYQKHQAEALVPAEILASQDAKGRSRFDFLLQDSTAHPGQDCYVEVKSVTYALDQGLGVFPDAVSTRALKHLQALVACRQAGYRAVLLFCVQHTGIQRVAPARQIYPQYADALALAVTMGVEVLAYAVHLAADEFVITQPLEVDLLSG